MYESYNCSTFLLTDSVIDAASLLALRSADLTTPSDSVGDPNCSLKRSYRRTGSIELLEDSSSNCWRPSYVSLSCAVSGYTDLTRYDSEWRKELSRGRSPREPLRSSQLNQQSGERRVPSAMPLSPLKVQHKLGQESAFIRKPRSPAFAALSSPRSLSVDRASNSTTSTSRRMFIASESTSLYTQSSGLVMNGHHHFNGDAGESEDSPVVANGTAKSFILQRIERLYGAAASQLVLKGGPSPRSSPDKENRRPASRSPPLPQPSPSPETTPAPPVFRHLRPEFRDQLRSHPCPPAIPVSSSLILQRSEGRGGLLRSPDSSNVVSVITEKDPASLSPSAAPSPEAKVPKLTDSDDIQDDKKVAEAARKDGRYWLEVGARI